MKAIRLLDAIALIVFIVLAFLLCRLAEASTPPLDPVSPSAISGAFSSLMSESFQTDLATGAATMNIPIVVPPGRKNVQPNITLFYSSSNGNGICGMGWSIPVSAIQRSTKKGVPRYSYMDNIVVGSEELVDIGSNEYRAKIESSFTKYVYNSSANSWAAYDKSGTEYQFGTTQASRMTNPENSIQVFAWYLDKVSDVYGNTVTYSYEKNNNSVYLKYIDYTSNSSCDPVLNADKRVEFIYESTERPDKIYSYRTGWSSVIAKRLEKIKITIDANNDQSFEESEKIWIYNLSYALSSDTGRSLLTSIQLEDSESNTLPAKTFTYQTLEQ